ncbi:MAG TPA: FKBP-type peptidyl-prolyl cis-trans isomerase, partial [Pirellulales bacterium]|nr:FKBP-type peptidyl-prolyl cis-trans isomerase [Pirellulales bacterium]
LPAFADGIKAGIEGTESKYTEAEMREVMMKFQTRMIEKQVQAQKKAADAASQKEKKFFDQNKNKDGISSTDSGLQYRIIKSGEGPKPTASDSVTVHYRGTLTDGTVFDSSYERGEPVTFKVDRVIAGWTEALQLMHEGDKWELYIPSTLAYGSHGAGGRIGPNETLVFEVELIKVGSAASAGKKAGKGVS